MSRFIVLFATVLLFYSPAALAQESSLGSGEIRGTLGKIDCNILTSGKLQLQRASNQRKLARRKAFDIQKRNRKILKKLRRQTRVVTSSINQLRVRRDVGVTISELTTKTQRKLEKLEKQVERLGIAEIDFGVTAEVSQVEDELAELQILLDEQNLLLKEANKLIRSCKGCAADIANNIPRSKRMKTCGCYTKEIPSTLTFVQKNYTGDNTTCTALGLIQWSETDDVNGSRWTISYDIGFRRESEVSEPPFDDNLVFMGTDGAFAEFIAPAGVHQIAVGVSGIASVVEADCSEILANLISGIRNQTVQVEFCPAQ